MKGAVRSTSLLSASTVARYSSLEYLGSRSCTLRSPNRITSIRFGSAYKACSTWWTAGALFGGIYAPARYHLRDPDIVKKLSTLGTNLIMPSNCHPASSLHTTDVPPRCLLSATIAHTAYPAPFRACTPSVVLVSCSTPTSTLTFFSARSSASSPPAPPPT